ncbi:MAG: DUF2946 family protein, partial [Burkholderiaceae bacterium]
AAMAKWPGVPDAHGWMRLTARGEWLIEGERVANDALRDFIGRNYEHDAAGQWFFQNGPQRVYVELESTPWIWRLGAAGELLAHTGVRPTQLVAAFLLDDERVVLVTDLGAGQVDDRDVANLIEALTDRAGMPLSESGLERWLDGREEAFLAAAVLGLAGGTVCLGRCRSAELPALAGFVREPLIR